MIEIKLGFELEYGAGLRACDLWFRFERVWRVIGFVNCKVSRVKQLGILNLTFLQSLFQTD